MIDKSKVLYQMGVLMCEMSEKNADDADDADLRRDANIKIRVIRVIRVQKPFLYSSCLYHFIFRDKNIITPRMRNSPMLPISNATSSN